MSYKKGGHAEQKNMHIGARRHFIPLRALSPGEGHSLQMMSEGVREVQTVYENPISQTGCVDYHRKQTPWHLPTPAGISVVNKHPTAANVPQIAEPGICLQYAARITVSYRLEELRVLIESDYSVIRPPPSQDRQVRNRFHVLKPSNHREYGL